MFQGVNETNTSHVQDERRLAECVSPRTNFVFIKVHKAGSTTTAAVMARFALRRNLSVMSPVSGGGVHAAWPNTDLTLDDFYHTPDEVYNVLFHHTVYNKEWMERKFPSDTAYLAIIRQPFSHLKSTFNFYGIDRSLPFKNKDNPLKEFLKNPSRYPTSFRLRGVLVDKTRNAQAFDLGYPVEKATDMKGGEEYIEQLDRDFTLVLILEYFDHSLVMLRRLMCWETKDILYDTTPRRQQKYPYKSYRPTEVEREAHRQWSPVDYAMYHRFNQTLWQKIAQQGPDFFQELTYFRQVNQQVNEFCRQKKPRAAKQIPESTWGSAFNITDQSCSLLRMYFKAIDSKIGKQQGRPVLKVPCERKDVGPTTSIPFFLQGGPMMATFAGGLKMKKRTLRRLTHEQREIVGTLRKELRRCQDKQKGMKDVFIEGMGKFKKPR
ncbi:GAL3ST1 [Branchiostoma lanceolatum]|uniref:GAL3ST1 protein n=1 Tax=Branchiostoma lanceolatum TaxID=7740 RepID=A0A8K0EGZ6_BRALA|nr:GAL3ST1 [Branchiostoma lanceolatum]